MSDKPVDLLPCPFCGGTPRLVDAAGWEIWCNCGAHLLCDDPARETVTTAWNRRAQRLAPSGWKLVPYEPTPEMLHVATAHCEPRAFAAAWRFMWKFAPSASPQLENDSRAVAFHDKDQPNGIAWCPGFPDGLKEMERAALICEDLIPKNDPSDWTAYAKHRAEALKDAARAIRNAGVAPSNGGKAG